MSNNDRDFSTFNIPYVSSYNYKGGEIAAKRLMETGGRNLAFIHTCSNVYGETYKRKLEFIDIYKKNGIN